MHASTTITNKWRMDISRDIRYHILCFAIIIHSVLKCIHFQMTDSPHVCMYICKRKKNGLGLNFGLFDSITYSQLFFSHFKYVNKAWLKGIHLYVFLIFLLCEWTFSSFTYTTTTFIKASNDDDYAWIV